MGRHTGCDPTISILLLTYNQQTLVVEALASLLGQTRSPLEIVVSDDASTDGTWQEVQRVAARYTGSIQLVLNRNERNLGIGGNVQRAIELSRGELIFLAAGDDVSSPDRCEVCVDAWLQQKDRPDLVAADAWDMDFGGEVLGTKHIANLQDWTLNRWFTERPFQVGASHMLTRRLATLNPLRTDLGAEDQVFIFRALLLGGAMRVAQPLVKHRRGGVSRKQVGMTYDHKRGQLLKGAANGLAEARQMLQDATKLGLEAAVAEPLQKQIVLNEYIPLVLNAPSWRARVMLLLRSGNMPASRRWRYFSFSNFAGFYRLMMWLKTRLA